MKKMSIWLACSALALGVAGVAYAGVANVGKAEKVAATDGVTATFDFSVSYGTGTDAEAIYTNLSETKGNIKFSIDSQAATTNASNPFKMYASHTFTFEGVDTSTNTSVTSVTSITSAVFTCTAATGNYSAAKLIAGTWTGATATASSSTVTAVPTATSFSVTTSAQVRITKLVITYNTSVTNVDPVTSIALSSASGTIKAGKDVVVTPTILPSTANQNVTAASASTAVATVAVNADHTVTVTGVAVGSTTITITTVGVDASSATKSATYAVTVAEFGWSDLRPAYVFDTSLANASITLKGVVTKMIAGTSFALQSGDQAIYGFSYSAVSNIAVGNYVSVTGTVSSYNGLIELGSPVATVLAGTAPSVTTTTVTESMIANYVNTPAVATPGLTGLDSTLVSVSGIKLSAALTATAATAISGTANVGAVSLGIYANKSDVTSTTVDAFNAFFGKAGAIADDIVFNGVLGWNSNKPQLSLTAASELSSAEVTAVDNFVATYVNITAGTCADRWTAAKNAFAALTTVEQNMFKTNTGYTAMYNRYVAWATANGEAVSASNVSMMNESTAVIAVAVVSVLGLLTLAGVMVVRKKHN
jgi:hypothetical protein